MPDSILATNLKACNQCRLLNTYCMYVYVPMQAVPDSMVATNLKACNQYRLFNGKAAEAELRHLADISGGAHLQVLLADGTFHT